MKRPFVLLSALAPLIFSAAAFSQPALFLQPERVTVYAGQNFSPAVSPDGQRMVFVSDRNGHLDLFLKSLTRPGSRAVPLTRSSSADTSPSWSPDGRRIAFVSRRDDPDGDIFILDLTAPESGRAPKRLTGIETADSSPVWTPDAGSLYFTSRVKTEEREKIWRVDLKTGNRQPVTEGSMPALSPDGRVLAYVIASGKSSHIALMRLADGKTVRWTKGPDAFPAWKAGKIYFSRSAEDTNLDGRLTFDDNPSIWSGDYSGEIFDNLQSDKSLTEQGVEGHKLMSYRGNKRPRFRQLTSGRTYDISPCVSGAGLYYVSYSQAPGLPGNMEILSLPATGIFPVHHDLKSLLLRIDREASPYLKIAAWRNLLYDFPPDPSVAASVYYKIGKAFQTLGNRSQALEVFRRVAGNFPEAPLYEGLSRVETVVIRTQLRAMKGPPGGKAALEQGARELKLLAEATRGRPLVSGTARLRQGDLLLLMKEHEKALAVYDGVAEEFKGALAAEALVSKAKIYADLGASDKIITVYLDVLRRFPDISPWSGKAVEAILEAGAKTESPEKRVARLYRLAEQYAGIPVLAAAALVKAGETYYNDHEDLRAKQAFHEVMKRFPGEKKAVTAAKFRLAKIYFEEEDFDRSFQIYRELEVDPATAFQSRKEFIARLLAKGERELHSGEARLALKTFRKIIAYDYRIVEAHRGLVRAYASLKETDKAVDFYKAEIGRLQKKGPLSPAHYGLGLALTYLKPPSLKGSREHLLQAITRNGTVSYYFQTLGWVYEQEFRQTGDNATLEKAADAYQTALSLSRGPAKNIPDLRLNLGNVLYRSRNFGGAYAQYKKRLEAGAPFGRGKEAQTREALYYRRFGEAAFKLGKSREAIDHFSRAITLLKQSSQGRIAELLSRKGLAYQDRGEYEKAAESFSLALERYRKEGDQGRMAITLRNIATNLYFSTRNGKGRQGKEALLKALNRYFETIRLMEARGARPMKKKKKGGALVQIEIEQGLDEESSRSAMGFSRTGEEKLVFNYIGKIYGDFREYDKAVEYFKKKLSLTPSDLPVEGNVPVLLERAIIENQIGNYLYLSGKYTDSLSFFQRSLEQSMRLRNSFGIATNAVNMGKLCSEAVLTGKKLRGRTVRAVTAQLEHSIRFLRGSGDYAKNGVLIKLWNLAGMLAFALSQDWVQEAVSPEPKEASLILAASLKKIEARFSLLKKAKGNFQEAWDALRDIPEGNRKKALASVLNHNLRIVSSRLETPEMKTEGPAPGGKDDSPPDLRWQLTFLSAAFVHSDAREMAILGRAREELLKTPFNGRSRGRLEREMAAELFKRLAWLLMKSGKTEEAFLTAERGRQWALREARAPAEAETSAPLPKDLLKRARSILKEGEAVIRAFRYHDTLLEWVITGESIQGALLPCPGPRASLNALCSPVFHPPYRRLYLIADPATAGTRWETREVMYLVSLNHLVRSYARRNLRLAGIFLAGPGTVSLPDGAFRNTSILKGDPLNRKNFLPMMKKSGVTAITAPVVLLLRDPAHSYLDLSGAGIVGRRINVEELHSEGYLGALADIRPVKTGESAAFGSPPFFFAYLVLVDAFSRAGYPYVLINTGPFNAKQYGRLASVFFGNLRSHPPIEALLMAGEAGEFPGNGTGNYKLFGYGGMRRGERLAFARENLKKTLSLGMKSFKQKDWIGAEKHLEYALSLLDALGIDKYRDVLYKRLAAAAKARNDYQNAVRYQVSYLQQTLKQKKPARIADAYYYLGYLYYKAEDFALAEKNLRRAIDLYSKNHWKDKMAAAYARLGIAQAKGLNYRKAVASLGISRAISSETGQSLHEGRQLNWIGSILLLRLNDYPKAARTFRNASRVLTPLKAWKDILESRLGLARAYEKEGDFKKALHYLRQARDLAEAHGLENKGTECQLEFANVSWFQGNYQKAFTILSRALDRAERKKDKKIQSLIHGTTGLLYWTLNDYRRALDNLERGLELAGELGSDTDTASALNNIGLVYRDRKEYGTALEYFQKAAQIDLRIKSRWGLGYDYRNLGMTRLGMGDLEKAEEEIGLALKWSGEIHDRVNVVKAMLEKGNIALKRARFQEALEIFDKTRALAENIHVREVLWRAVQGKARALAGLGHRDESIDQYRQGVRIVEAMRSAIKVEELRNGFAENKTNIYEELIIQLLNEDNIKEAFNYSERARARSFIDLLGNQKISLKDSLDQQAFEKIRDLKREIEEKENALKGSQAPKQAAKALREQKNRYRDALIALKSKNPQLSNFVTVDPLRLKEIHSLMDAGTTLLEYMVTKDETVAWVLKKDSIKAVRIPAGKKKLTGLVRDFRERIQSLAPLEKVSTRLYDLLIRPLAKDLAGSRRLGIIPHSVLHYLSFAALRDAEGYLVEKYPIFTLPSASVLRFTMKKEVPKPPRETKVLAIGNPDLGNFNYDLPLAEMEADSMRWDFPSIDILTRDRARESWIVSHIGDYDIIHIASHGEFDPINPLFSSLKLARDIRSDGNLEVNEVFGLDIKAGLVTLSACQTGLGKVTGGDELIGLNRAFFYAGARSLVSSLWRISDVSTAVLIKHFYRNYGHMSKAEALRKAQLLVKRYYPHPAYWSGFILTGNYH